MQITFAIANILQNFQPLQRSCKSYLSKMLGFAKILQINDHQCPVYKDIANNSLSSSLHLEHCKMFANNTGLKPVRTKSLQKSMENSSYIFARAILFTTTALEVKE